jgi:hypothetical protein
MKTMAHIVTELESLPPAKLTRAASYIHRLASGRRLDRKRALAETAGCLTATEVQAMESCINGHCERIDYATWPSSR